MECEDGGNRDVIRAAAAAALVLLLFALGLAIPSAALAAPRSGVLLAFGEDSYGQLGTGNIEMANHNAREVAPFQQEAELPGPEPRERALVPNPAGRLPVVEAAAGENFSLAVTAQGELDAFGWNRYRQIAIPWENGVDAPPSPVDRPTAVTLPLKGESGVVRQVAAGYGAGFAVTTTGMLYSWGLNNRGQTGVKGGIECTPSPKEGNEPKQVKLPSEERAAQVAAGHYFTLVLTQTGKVFGFGSNQYGQLGTAAHEECGPSNYEPEEAVFPASEHGERIVDIAAGYAFGLAVTSGGRVFAFGLDEDGATGPEAVSHSYEPREVPLPGGEHVVQAAAGEHFTLLLTSTGAVYSLGNNRFGQLGRPQQAGTATAEPQPARVQMPPGSGRPVHLAAGEENSLVVTETGRLYTFGGNTFGQLGAPLNFETLAPDPLPGLVTLPGALKAEDAAQGTLARDALVIAGEPKIENAYLPSARTDRRFRVQMSAAGGRAPYAWSAAGLPRGVAINRATGLLVGRPRRGGRFAVRVSAVDAFGIRVGATFRLAVQGPGPAITALRIRPAHWGRSGHVSFHLSHRAVVRVHVCLASPSGCRPIATVDEHTRSGTVHLTIGRRAAIGRHRPTRGKYELYITASDRAGTTSSPRLSFTIG